MAKSNKEEKKVEVHTEYPSKPQQAPKKKKVKWADEAPPRKVTLLTEEQMATRHRTVVNLLDPKHIQRKVTLA